jgi:hypothetical protein
VRVPWAATNCRLDQAGAEYATGRQITTAHREPRRVLLASSDQSDHRRRDYRSIASDKRHRARGCPVPIVDGGALRRPRAGHVTLVLPGVPAPGPDPTSWRCEEPSARTEVGGGTLAIHVDRFERAHDQVQIMDNPKHLLLSTESFTVPAEGCTAVSMEMAATSRGA